MPHLIMKQATS